MIPSDKRKSLLYRQCHLSGPLPHPSGSFALEDIEEESEWPSDVEMAVDIIPDWDELLNADDDVRMLDALSPRGTCFSSACPWQAEKRILEFEVSGVYP